MFDDIKKILQNVKRGVVIVENGKPSYVLLPFKDFESSLSVGKESGAYENSQEQQAIDDPSLIQKMVDYEVEMNSKNISTLEEMNAVLDKSGQADGDQAKEINLEDLPF